MVEMEVIDDDLDLFELDIALFKTNYPKLYKQYKAELNDLSYDEIDEIIPNNDSVIDLILKKEAVKLKLSNNTTQNIYNTDLLSWYSYVGVDWCSIVSDSKFVYFILSPIQGQAGSLGIWDTNKKDWIFDYCDEGFCVESVLYSDVLDIFVGYYEWNIPMNPQHGEKFFLIDKNRSYREIETENIYDASCCTNSDVDNLDSYQPSLNMDMKSNFASNRDMWLIVDIKQKLAVIDDNKQKKILSAYKLQMLEFV